METAGNKDYDPDSDVEKKGLGTPATRAGTIETLIRKGNIYRKGKNILVTDRGKELIKIVPNSLKSTLLTVLWETRLQQIEKGELKADSFMSDITAYTQKLVADHSGLKPIEGFGICPKCGGTVYTSPKAYSCDKNCGFIIWGSKCGRDITTKLAKALLEKGRTEKVKGFKSAKRYSYGVGS
jgi:DNA topoisomerase-3